MILLFCLFILIILFYNSSGLLYFSNVWKLQTLFHLLPILKNIIHLLVKKENTGILYLFHGHWNLSVGWKYCYNTQHGKIQNKYICSLLFFHSAKVSHSSKSVIKLYVIFETTSARLPFPHFIILFSLDIFFSM